VSEWETPCCAAAPSVRCEAEVDERLHECFVMNSGVSATTAESDELDDEHSSQHRLRRLLLCRAVSGDRRTT
jgi:hypothetical protein